MVIGNENYDFLELEKVSIELLGIVEFELSFKVIGTLYIFFNFEDCVKRFVNSVITFFYFFVIFVS